MSKATEWELLKRQFDALTPNESIEDILDAQFRRRFTELMDQTAQRSPMEYKGQNVRYWHKADMLIAAWNVRYWG